MYTKQIYMTDRLVREKAPEIINAYNEMCDRTTKVDLKLNNGW